MWLFLLFLLVPLIEIGLFIQVGGWIGLWPTLAIVVLTAIAGTALVKSQGLAALQHLQQSFQTLNDPTEPLAHGAMILFSGALLLTPGFFTDVVGFLLLVPAVRSQIMKSVGRRIEVHHAGFTQQPRQDHGDIIDGEYTVEPNPSNSDPSGWTRH